MIHEAILARMTAQLGAITRTGTPEDEAILVVALTAVQNTEIDAREATSWAQEQLRALDARERDKRLSRPFWQVWR